MAKTKASLSIKDIQTNLRKINPFGDTIDKSEIAKVNEFIPTGNYHLNALLSADLFGGIPSNRSVCLSGESGCVQKNQKIKIYKIKSDLNLWKRKINVE